MLSFDYQCATRLVFGKDAHLRIGELAAPLGGRALLHYGGSSAKASGTLGAVEASLRAAGIAYEALGGVVPNPRVALVREGVDLCRRHRADFVLAVGGGSVIDSAKAIALGACRDGDVWEVYAEGLPIGRALPVACVLTLPAAGSESSVNSVITHEAERRKLGYGHPLLRPAVSAVNPELFFTLPPAQIAHGAADMMCHVFERYFTPTPRTDLTDALCEATLRVVMANAPRALANPRDGDAWDQLGFAGSLAHNNLLGQGRAQDWSCHAMEHELSARYDVPHGAGLAVVTPAWMRYLHGDHPALFAQWAHAVMGVPADWRAPATVAREGIRRLSEFWRSLGLPATLGDLGIGGDRLEDMARKATRADRGEERPLGASSLRPLRWQDVLAIYRLAL